MKEQTALTQLVEGKLPEMVRWYHPSLLFRVGVRTIVSSVFGQYADQRLIQAATDPGSVQDIMVRYDYSNPNAAAPHQKIEVDANGAYWIDYLSDTGDGFESTYTMAYLTALDSLRVNDADGKTRLRLNHGDILIMGGDQCYPQGSREDYMQKLVTPFQWALDVPMPTRKLFAIPGNHDWYDGLAAFDSLFCASRGDRLSPNAGGTQIGGWQCQQHRSYWALKLPHGWWIWGTDIQFSKYLDTAQIAYFEAKAAEMKEGDKLVLCIAEPSWLLNDFGKPDEEENFFKITSIARRAGAKICAVVAGDWHHYARYYSPQLDVHFITAGGGGSFLHPTHVLRNDIKVEWPAQNAPTAMPSGTQGPVTPGWHKEQVDIRLRKAEKTKGVIADATAKVGEVVEDVVVEPIEAALKGKRYQPRVMKPQEPKCYPERGRSMLISLRNVFFPVMNPGFGIGLGLIYWFITWEFYTLVERHDISSGEIDAVGIHTSFWGVYKYIPFYLIQGLLVSIPLALMLLAMWGCLVWYVDAGTKNRFTKAFSKLTVGSLHFLAHVMTMFALGLAFVAANNWIAPRVETYANSVWVASAGTGGTGSVAKKVLEPLSEGRAQQREMFGGDQRNAGRTSTGNRAAPPAVALPDGARPASDTNMLRTKSVRQLVGFILYPLEMIFLGGLVGGFIWGMYWVLTGLFLRMHSEDAFAALRIKHYKNFLRFKFEPDKLTIYPIGVDKVPGKRFWTAREGARNVPSNNPRLIAPHDIPVRLIEPPIVIYADGRQTS